MDPTSTAASASVATSPLGAACAVLHIGVCVEAIRTIFALHFLSRSGVDHLTEHLRHCHRADGGAGENAHFSPPWEAEDSTRSAATASYCLVERHALAPRRWGDGTTHDVPHGAPVRSPDPAAPSWSDLSFATSAAARSCLERASPLGLYTAVHLLRCSAWTADSLTAVALNSDTVCATSRTSVSSAISQLLLKQAHSLELLRTDEPAWCATVLVRYTEWLLREDGRHTARAQLAAALSLTEYERLDATLTTTARILPTARQFHGATSSSASGWLVPPTAETSSSAAAEGPVVYADHVVVQDALPLFFPSLRAQPRTAREGSDAENRGLSLPNASCCCGHQWLLESLPRWCTRVAAETHARKWHQQQVLRNAVVRWRTRRGLRFMAQLSHAAEQQMEALKCNAATMGGTDGGGQRTGEEVGKERTSSASSAVSGCPQRREAECQTPALRVEDRADLSTPPRRPVELRAPPVVEATPPPVQRGEAQPGSDAGSPTTSSHWHADVTTRSAATAFEVSLLDRILQRHSSEHLPFLAERSDVACSSCSAGDHEEPPASHPSSRPEQPRSPVVQWTAAQTRPTPAEDDEERSVSFIQQQCRFHSLRAVFLLWRNGRLYEAMATRYLRDRTAASKTRDCWGVWRGRLAFRVQRRKVARDHALVEVVTEQKAVQYFRRLLNVWRRAAVARRFLLHTLADRALHTWRCQAILIGYRRSTRQPFVGARRQLGEAWRRWCSRRQEAVADQQRARHALIGTFALMKACCNVQHMLRVADTLCSKKCVTLVWRTWRARLARDRPPNSPAHNIECGKRLRERAWKQWRVRALQRGQGRRHYTQSDRFYVSLTLRHCLVTWRRRCDLERCVRACAERHSRALLLKPAFERWHMRAEVCEAVRRGREEMAWRVGEQLMCRKVLRVWQRRATAHAAVRKATAAAQMDDKAVSLARAHRLARYFYRWRTRQLVLRRYDVDRRRTLPEEPHSLPQQFRPAAASVAAAAPPLVTAKDPAAGVIATASFSAAASVVHDEHAWLPATNTPVPVRRLPSRPVTSTTASRSVSTRVSPPPRRRPTSTTSRPRTPQRQRRTALENAAAAPTATPDDRISMARRDGAPAVAEVGAAVFAQPSAASPFTALAGGPRAVVCLPSAPPRQRALALERQLFAAQRHTTLGGFVVCVPLKPAFGLTFSAVSRKDALAALPRPTCGLAGSTRPPPTRLVRHKSRHARSPLPSPPHDLAARSSSVSSDAERRVPIRSHTATPLFKREQPGSWSEGTAAPHASYPASDLVESPPQHLRRQPRAAGRKSAARRDADAEQLDDLSSPSPRTSSNRLLSQMEVLLRRVRGIEADYRSPLPASSGGYI